MSVRCRPLRLKDIPNCVEHIAIHPILGPRYGKLIEQLPSALRLALANETTWFGLLEELQGLAQRFIGVNMYVFVSDEFIHELKTAPRFWIGPELVKRLVGGKSPLVSEREVRDANSAAGLNLLVWHLTCYPQDILRADVATTLLTACDQHFRGLRLREVLGQADCVEHYYAMRNAGGFYFDRVQGTYGNYPELNPLNFSDEPRACGLTRDLAFTQPTSWLASFFVSYAPPRLVFSLSEQRLLCAARGGDTDEELSNLLGISIHAVKMKWRMIYDRAEACLPELFAETSRADMVTQYRGKEKKQRMLDYIRRHPEELHPVSRKLLLQGAKKG